MKKQFFFAFAAAALLASCSNEDAPFVSEGNLKVFGTIDELKTRATDTNWAEGDQIGVSGGDATNVMYQFSSGNAFTSATGIKVDKDATTEFTAYYPYAASLSGNTISFDASNQSGVDFLWAKNSASAGAVAFNFKHKMSKLSFTVNDQTEGLLTGYTLSLAVQNLAVAGEFDVTNGNVTASGTGSINLGDVVTGAPVAAIVPPTASENDKEVTVVITATNGDQSETYVGTVTPTLVAGTQYNYTLNLMPDATVDDRVALEVTSGEITGWEQGGTGSADLNKQEKPNVLEVGDYLLKDGTVVDMNYSKLSSVKDQIVGVVFYVGNPQATALNYTSDDNKDALKRDFPNAVKGLALAINNANSASMRFQSQQFSYTDWFKEYANNSNYLGDNLSLTSEGSKMLGYNNTELIKLAQEDKTDEEVGAADLVSLLGSFNESNEVVGASDWYVPSYAELKVVLDNYTTIAESLVKVGGTLQQFDTFDVTVNGNNELFYWTSDMRGAKMTWVTPMYQFSEIGGGYYPDRNSNGKKGWFRFAIAF